MVVVWESNGPSHRADIMLLVVAYHVSPNFVLMRRRNKVRDQDVCSPIASMGANARCQSFLWAWFQENFETIHKRFYSGSFLMGRIVSACCQGFASEARAAEINAFFEKSSLETDAIKRAIRQSVESVRANVRCFVCRCWHVTLECGRAVVGIPPWNGVVG